MTYDDLFALVRRFEGQTLETVRGRRFKVGLYRDGAFFTPESSGYGQSDGRAAAERFVERYNATRSLRPGDYAKVTRNASYYIALLIAAGARPGAGAGSAWTGHATDRRRPRHRRSDRVAPGRGRWRAVAGLVCCSRGLGRLVAPNAAQAVLRSGQAHA